MPGWQHEVLRDRRATLSRLLAERQALLAAKASAPAEKFGDYDTALVKNTKDVAAEEQGIAELELQLGVHKTQEPK